MPKNSTTHHPLPVKGVRDKYDPNWEALERSFNQNLPVCVTAQGFPGPILAGSPGPISYITWTQPTNPLFDVSNIVGPTPTQNLRIPQDGFYDFWYQISVSSSTIIGPGGGYALHSVLETATTSDDGQFTTPVFSLLIDGPSKFFLVDTVALNGDNSMQVIYRGIEMHANDLFRMGLNMFVDVSGPGVAEITGATVVLSEFRFTYPIPNNQKRQP